MDLFPFYPPSVRLVRPRLKNFMIGRIICMEELTLSKWNSTRTMIDILNAIRRLLTTYGEVDDSIIGINDLHATIPPYTAIEFQLLRLSMLTEIIPRIVKLYTDIEQKQFIVPKLKTKLQIEKHQEKEKQKQNEKQKEKEKTKENNETTDAYMSVTNGTTKKKNEYWASGTGYGYGRTNTNDQWDPEAFIAAQRKKDAEIQEITTELVKELQNNTIADTVITVLDQSCLIPF